ncbi:PilW family protein [Synechococcus sp. PCC 7336]|uniref:PilW family protein n=1 Tax=Synechococcus sp. PCC 7336 TaxID=195250 RepID=UPI00034924B8|nr:hypothetical protein [Synechococcus sp. PCC 7336]
MKLFSLIKYLLKTEMKSPRNLGFTLTELVVSGLIASGLFGVAFTLVFANRNLYIRDRERTAINQDLRAAIDIVGNDIRQGGERLPSDFPAIVVVNGVGGAPDQLIVRRSLSNPLNVCGNIAAGGNSNISLSNMGISGCDTQDTTLNDWSQFRMANGDASGIITAAIYDTTKINQPSQGIEFFPYDGEDLSDSTNLMLSRGTGTWADSYLATDQPRIYILQENRYFLSSLDADPGNCFSPGAFLTLVTNRNCATGRFGVSSQIDNFFLQVCLEDMDGNIACQANLTAVQSANRSAGWRTLARVDVGFTGSRDVSSDLEIDRTIASSFFPRNVLSFD